ncbi:MAG: multicopper oxidase domain-containing protein [Pirellulales bacterium]|nr:multicopper oxidase domain-containing protein [Pirellulales bacterium]
MRRDRSIKASGKSDVQRKFTRRQLLKTGAIAGGGLLLPWVWTPRKIGAAPIPGGTLDPLAVPKFVEPLVIPPVMPPTATNYYEIAVRQFTQQILPAGLPSTTVWSYGSVNHPGTFNYPAFTLETESEIPIRVKWINGLVDGSGNYLPHLLAVDPTLHWANPPGGDMGRDMRPEFTETPGPYTGPVPMVTHVHGAHTAPDSDGYAEAWYLPAAGNIPAGYATVGTYYDLFGMGAGWEPGTAVFDYPNDQRPSTIWYHDHTLGMTRLNVYAGPAGFYIIRGGDSLPNDGAAGILPGPAPALGDPLVVQWPTTAPPYREIPLAIQDRSFNADGSLFYPGSRLFFDGYGGPYMPDTDLSPIWNPEFFGNMMLVNGKTWPYLNVEQCRYRFRFLNGCNSRFIKLEFDKKLDFWQIGSEGGLLPAPVRLKELLMSPAERADVIVDFSKVKPGTTITLLNTGTDAPFGGLVTGQVKADPATTGMVMQFRVVGPPSSPDNSTPPDQLGLPTIPAMPAPVLTRQVSLNEMMSMYFPGPAAAMLGTVDPVTGMGHHLMWDDPVTESPALNTSEIWEIHNFTADAHPIHIHEIMFQVLNRQKMGAKNVRVPESWETGRKDTVIAYPGEITRIQGYFDIAGRYVWHCHIVEHEDNEMMRPYDVV